MSENVDFKQEGSYHQDVGEIFLLSRTIFRKECPSIVLICLTSLRLLFGVIRKLNVPKIFMANMYQVRKLQSSDEASYANFVDRNEGSLLFQSLSYLKLIRELTSSKQETLLAVDQEETIKGVLPLLSATGKFGTVYNSLPYYGSNGGIIGQDDEAVKTSSPILQRPCSVY